MPEIAVVGGGITGLAAAWYVHRAMPEARVTVLEAANRPGGKIRTDEFAGVPVESGPDTFLARVPWATDLCRELGLGDELVEPATGQAYVWARGRLRRLPEGLALGVPARLGPLARSGIVSTRGVARAALDTLLPRRRSPEDPSVADVVAVRLGQEVVDNLVEPLLGGIHAGRADRLSLASVAPVVADAATHHRSLLAGLRRQPRCEGPVFLTVTGGLSRLVDRLDEGLAQGGVKRRFGVEVKTVERANNGRWTLHEPTAPDAITADAVILTVPAHTAAAVLAEALPAVAAELGAIRYASVVTATLAYRPEAVGRPLDGSGFLVPRVDRRLITACTWSSTKWPTLQESGLVLLRASCGRIDDDTALRLDDDELVCRVHTELSEAMGGLSEPPVGSHVTKWPRSLPQYDVGHRARVERIESALGGSAPGLHLAGAAYHGLGIAACVRAAREAAGRCLESHSARPRRNGASSAV